MKQNARSNAARRAASRDGRRGRDARGTTTTRTTSPSSRARARAAEDARERARTRERRRRSRGRAVAARGRSNGAREAMETREGRLTRIWFVSLAGRRFARRARFACTRARDRTSIARLVILRAITRVVVTSLRLSRASCTRNRRRATSTPSKVWAVSAASSSRSVCSERWRSRRRVWPASKKRTMSSQTTTDRVFPRSSNSLSVERLESSAPSGGAIPKSTPLARFSQIARARRCDRRK